MPKKRELRLVFTSASAAIPALLVALEPACGSDDERLAFEAPTPVARDASFTPSLDSRVPPQPTSSCASLGQVHVVELPEPGTPADPGQLCTVMEASTVTSSDAARVTLEFSTGPESSIGLITIPPAIKGSIVGLPTVSLVSATMPEFEGMQTSGMAPVAAGFLFQATWPEPFRNSSDCETPRITLKVTFTLACADGGTQVVESLTKIDLCTDPSTQAHPEWVSSGDSCCVVCRVIAEMAPSPIVSDNTGDDLPLGRVVRLRVVEVARAGRDVLLFAENDGGADADYEWRVSAGSIRHIADDVVLWTLPEESEAGLSHGHSRDPLFGQVAVIGEHGAAVENFLWGIA